MKRAVLLLLLVVSGFWVYAQGSYISPPVRKRLDSTFRHFSVTDKKISGFQLGIGTGVFAPQGNLSVLGPHVYLGLTSGWRFNKFMLDASFYYRFNNAPNNYTVNFKDTLYQTNVYHGGGYWGLDLGYELYKSRKHEVDILAGAAFDFFTSAFNNGIDTMAFSSFNFNIGIGYKIFLRHIRSATYLHKYTNYHSKKTSFANITCAERYSYLAFQVKYNFLGYTNPGGTSLSGNAITVGVVYGLYRHPVNNHTVFRGKG